jgi:hypothetical protein
LGRRNLGRHPLGNLLCDMLNRRLEIVDRKIARVRRGAHPAVLAAA